MSKIVCVKTDKNIDKTTYTSQYLLKSAVSNFGGNPHNTTK